MKGRRITVIFTRQQTYGSPKIFSVRPYPMKRKRKRVLLVKGVAHPAFTSIVHITNSKSKRRCRQLAGGKRR